MRLTHLCRFHGALGLFALFVFLATGAYMRLVAHPSDLPDRAHLMFVSRHIYILASALVHLVLAAYIVPCTTRGRLTVQWIASALLCVSSVLLISAFVIEPVAGRARTDASTFGLYTLFAGALLHFFVARQFTRETQ